MKTIYKISALLLALVLTSCKHPGGNKPSSENGINNSSSETSGEQESTNKNNNGFDGLCKENISIIKKVDRKLPEVKNEGLASYPKYGENFTETSLVNSIYEENKSLLASSTTYDAMDKDGNLILNGNKTGKKLYKHSASIGLYDGNVSNNEQAYEKKIEISPRKTGNYITGSYAPAGEVIEIMVSEETLEQNPNLKVSIGQTTQTGSPNNIPNDKTLTRMPCLTNFMDIKQTTTYVGSYFGGPIYVDGIESYNKKVELTISGAVNYSYFIYGNTTKEDYELYSKSSAPYFDLEVFDKGVRHSGTKAEAKDYSYDDLVKAAKLWKNISDVSKQIPSGSSKDIGITFLYDTYVDYGVAAAYVGKNYIQCYRDWLNGSLNYDSFVKDGSWGLVHEYNHHFQDYLKLDGEATNNAISLIEYYLFTNVSQKRTETYPEAGDWNLFADPYRSLKITNENQTKGELHDELNEYADILYSFGYEAYVNACKKCTRQNSYDQWFKALCEEIHYDLTYYFTKIINKTLSQETLDEVKAKNYPVFIPVASLYEVGRVNNGKDVMSVLPFIVSGNSYTLDLDKYLVVPNGFNYQIKEVKANDNVSISNTGNKYDVSFTGEETGNIYLTLDLNGNGISTSVTLILGLSKNYRDLTSVNLPYSENTNTKVVVPAQNTKLVDNTKQDGFYSVALYNPQNLNNGDDVDILFANNFELNLQPFNITMDMNETALVNKLTLCQGFTTSKNGPSKFKLYGGTTQDDMKLLGEYQTQYVDNYSEVFFDPTTIRYFKIEILAVGNSYETYYGDISLSRLEMSLDLGEGIVLSPFSEALNIEKAERINKVENTFGYVLKTNNSGISFETNKNRVVIILDEFEKVDVLVDGKQINVTNSGNVIIVDLDGNSKHSIQINGTYNLDSIMLVNK